MWRSWILLLCLAPLAAACSKGASDEVEPEQTGGIPRASIGEDEPRELFRPMESVRSLAETSAPFFPLERAHDSQYCTYPGNVDVTHVIEAYELFKEHLVTSDGALGHLRVLRPDTPDGIVNSTVSEGIAYGMVLAAYLDDQDTFDELWLYAQEFTNNHGLMYWYIDPEGTTACPGEEATCGAATDADEDMAWALLMADRQWGGGSERSVGEDYLTLAIEQIDRVMTWEVELSTKVVRPGDRWGGWSTTNPSYFAPAYYRVFAEVTGNDDWLVVAETAYDLIEASLNEENENEDNGLVPAWMDGSGAPKKPWADEALSDGGVDEAPTHYQYDSARTPFRIAQDYCYFGAPRAKAYLDKVNTFFGDIGPLNLSDGYELDGTPRPEASREGSDSAVFVAAAGVAAMADPGGRDFARASYERLTEYESVLVRSEYYQRSWTVLGLLMMNGLFFDLTQYAVPSGD